MVLFGIGLVTFWWFCAIQRKPNGYINSMILPSLALAVPVCASLIRVVRTTMVEEMDKDYVRTRDW